MVKRPPPKSDAQPDLFAANFIDVPIRDQRDTMERPFFSLSKKPRLAPIEYQVGNLWVKVSANPEFGMATIWDADILIWASTQITEALDRGATPTRRIQFHPYNLLGSIRRSTGGKDYARLRAALQRLSHTAVQTNVRTDGKKRFSSFHWLEGWTETIDERTGETTGMTLTLPDWLFTGITEQGGVLTIHEDYFLLTGGIERWLYRVARKHAGNQEFGWGFTMKQLYEKSGSIARLSDFAIDIREAVKANQIPEYRMTLGQNSEGDEYVHFVRRTVLPLDHSDRDFGRFPQRRVGPGIFSDANRADSDEKCDTGD